MIFDFKSVTNSFDDIYKEAQIIGGRELSGWNHETLVRLLRNHGILSYRQEFFGHSIDVHTMQVLHAEHSKDFEVQGLEKIKKVVAVPNSSVTVTMFWGEQKPVAAFVATGFNF
jgi:hypothetical protein